MLLLPKIHMPLKKIMNEKRRLLAIAASLYVVAYFFLFTPRLYLYIPRSDPSEDSALARPAPRWIPYPDNRREGNFVTGIYAPLIALDMFINERRYTWRAGAPEPAWLEAEVR